MIMTVMCVEQATERPLPIYHCTIAANLVLHYIVDLFIPRLIAYDWYSCRHNLVVVCRMTRLCITYNVAPTYLHDT